MMHNESNTDIEIIKKNYDKLNDDEKASGKYCVLLTTGSFNPIHRAHIQNLKLVKDHLEQHETLPMKVLAAYISPTHDAYVRSKLSGADWINGKKRCELCKDAIREAELTDFIAVSRGEVQCPNGFVDFDEVSKSLADFLNSKLHKHEELLKNPLTVVYVCGLDHFNKCRYVRHLATEANMACAVIYRLDADENDIQVLHSSSNVYYITLKDDRPTIDMSSTAFRRHCQAGNYADAEEISYRCVTDYYRRKFPKN